VSQIGAGALLLIVAVVELWLASWAAGWWHRCGASLVAAVGAVLLSRAVAAIGLRSPGGSAREALRPESVARRRAHPHIALAEWAQR
jgi:hypothetical protein